VNAQLFRERFFPWAGLALGTFGAGLAHQVGADSTLQDCRVGSPLIVIIAAIAGLILVGLGALGSWTAYGESNEAPARRIVSVVSLMACGLFAIAIILPCIAALVIPRCWQ
jgi:hypothetical protein